MAVEATLFFIRLVSHFFRINGGRTCRFEPSCSVYAAEAFGTYGYFKAFYLVAQRILRCHPFSQGGYDPVNSSS